MIRILSALLVSALLLGSVGLCQHLMTREIRFQIARDVDEHGHGDSPVTDVSDVRYTLIVTPGFDAADDPFAVKLDDTESTRLLVRAEDADLLASREDLRRGVPLTVSNLQFTADAVDVYVEATPNEADAKQPVPLRVQLYRGDVPTDDQTIWSHGHGQKLSGRVRLSLEPKLRKLDRGLGEEAQP